MSSLIKRLGALVLLICGATAAVATNAIPVKVVKEQIYLMDPAGFPRLTHEEIPHVFVADVNALGSSATGANLLLPDGVSKRLGPDFSGLGYLVGIPANDPAEMDRAFPFGVYKVSVTSRDFGAASIELNLTDANYPGIPRINNLAEAEAANPANDFVLRWDPIPGALPSDVITIQFGRDFSGLGADFNRTDLFGSNAIPGTATSVTMPAGSFGNNEWQRGEISIHRITEEKTNATGVLRGAIGVARSTRFGWGRPVDFAGVQTRDYLLSIEPHDGTNNVPDNSVVTLLFSDPLDTNVNVANALLWSGVPDTNSFRYSWNSNGTKLFCEYLPSWPLNTEIGLSLVQSNNNGFSPEFAFRSLAGQPIRSYFATGTVFTTSSQTAVGQPDVVSYSLGKTIGFRQDGAETIASGAATLEFVAQTSGRPSVAGVGVRSPNGEALGDRGVPHPRGTLTQFDYQYTDQASLDHFLPAGDYEVTFDTFRDGRRIATMDLSETNYPPIPFLHNWSAATSIDPAAEFELVWNAGPQDAVLVRVLNAFQRTVFSGPEIGQTGALSGVDSRFTVPAGTLLSGRPYHLELCFVKVVDVETSAYPGVVGRAYLSKSTRVPLHTTGTSMQPRIVQPFMSGGHPGIRISGESNAIYGLEVSYDLRSWYFHWPIFTGASSSDTSFTNLHEFLGSEFYRIREDYHSGRRTLRQGDFNYWPRYLFR